MNPEVLRQAANLVLDARNESATMLAGTICPLEFTAKLGAIQAMDSIVDQICAVSGLAAPASASPSSSRQPVPAA